MELFTFAPKFLEGPGGIKIPKFDKRILMAKNTEEAIFLTWLHNRPALILCQFEGHERVKRVAGLKKIANKHPN